MNSEQDSKNPGGGMIPREAEQTLKSDARKIADTAKEDVAGIFEEAKSDLGALADEGKHQIDEATKKAKGFANEQKDGLANHLDGIAQALHKVAAELDGQNAPTAGYAHKIADGVDHITRDLKANDVDGIMRKAEEFGRKQPAAFLAIATVAGFAASRFLRASVERRSPAPAPTGTDVPMTPEYPGAPARAEADFTGRLNQ